MTQDSNKSRTKKALASLREAVRTFQIELLITLWAWCIVANLFGYRFIDSSEVHSFYRESFRTPFFTGFLTLGSFLLSFKSFAIIRLISVFNEDAYMLRYVRRRKHVEGFNDEYLDPIFKLSTLIFYAIFLSLFTAAAQLSIGLLPFWWTALPCLWLATFTGLVLARTVRQLKRNIDLWLEVERERLAPRVEESIRNFAGNVTPPAGDAGE